MSVRLQKSEVIDHKRFQTSIANSLLSGRSRRLLKGRADANEGVFQQVRAGLLYRLRNLVSIIRRRHAFPALHRVAAARPDQATQIIGMFVGEKNIEMRREVDRELAALEQDLAMVGSENVPDLRAFHDQHEGYLRQLEQQARGTNIRQVVEAYRRSSRSPIQKVLHSFGINGRAERALESALNTEVALTSTREVLARIQHLISPDGTSLGSNNAIEYELPECSRLREQLEDIAFTSTDQQIVRLMMQSAVKAHFPEILKEYLRANVKNDLDSDFALNQQTVESKGLLVRSNVADQLRWLPEHLHVDGDHSEVVHHDEDVTEITVFWTVESFMGVPEIWNMIQRVEEEQQVTDDRRLYARTVKEIYPVLIGRTTRGVSLDKAGELVVMLSVVKDAAEKFRKRTDRLVVSYPQGRKSYKMLEEFASQLTLADEKHISDSFWLAVAEAPEDVTRKLADLEVGEYGQGEAARRLESLRSFVGATRWDNAVRELSKKVHNAKRYL